ncbi:MAG: NrfD/PsrC family molybdoenzyme membrane anchor subunit, partial [Actinomycetota bacterium]
PWDWRVSLYTWTKSIAAGIYIIPILLAFLGFVGWDSDLVTWVAPLGSLFFLAVTGALLIWDLTHPTRFYMIFTRPQWGSWLVRGAFIIAGFGGILSVHLLASILGESDWIRMAAFPGIPLATMTAVYTAYLFAQSKARDLWQSPLLPPHMFVQMILAGTAAVMLSGIQLSDRAASALEVALLVAAGTHLLMVLGEITLHHPTAHAHLATWEMTRGRYRTFFWAAAVLMVVALFAPLMGPAAGLFALAGLLAHEHAYVQAAQIVPLA